MKFLKATLPHLNWITKLILILAIMIMSATGALMIRLKKGPLDLDFAKVHIQDALSDEDKGYRVDIGKAQLVWPEVAGPLLIDLKGVKILQGESQSLNINEFAFRLSGLGLLKGKILPSHIIITNPDVKILNEDGSFNSFGQISKKPQTRVYGPIRPKQLRDSVKEFLAQIVDPKNAQIKTFAALERIQIENASLQNFKGEELANVNLILKKHDLGISGGLVIAYPETQEKAAVFRSTLLYRAEQEDLTFTATLQDLHTSHIAPFLKDFDVITQQNLFLNGDVKAAFNKDLKLQTAMIDINMPEGKFSFPELYDEDLVVKDFITRGYFNREKQQIEVSEMKMDLAGIPVEASLKGVIDNRDVKAPLIVNIAKTTPEALSVLLPKDEKESAIGSWIGYKLQKGTLSNINFTTELDLKRNRQTRKWDLDINKPKMIFDFVGMTVNYNKTLKSVERADGKGSYENDTLMIEANKGFVYGVSANDVTVEITNLSVKGGGYATIDIKAKGPLKDALKYVSAEPINAGDDLGFDVKNVRGDVDFNVNLKFPTLKDLPKEEVIVVLKGNANNLVLPDVVRGLSLTGGPYALGFKDGLITLNGKGKLGANDIDLDWMQYMDSTGKEFESKIKAKITADANLRKKFGIGLTDYLSGPLPVDVTYIDKGVKATIDVVGDLAPATLQIEPFKYKKDAGVAGDITLKAMMHNANVREVNGLKIETKGFQISNGRLVFKTLKDGSDDISQGEIPDVALGRTRAKVNFEVANDNTLKAVVAGSVVDITPFLKTDKSKKKDEAPDEDAQPMHISLQADKIIGDENEAITNTQMYLELDKAGEPTRIEMDANVGAGKMSLRFKPDSTGARNFTMQSTDAGYTLKVFGLYDKMRGGQMNINGRPHRGAAGDDLFGSAKISDFTIKGAPALAKLISAMSLKGVNGLIANEGVTFTKLESDFEWRFKEDGNLLVVKDGRTSGNELGLTFKGVVNMGTSNTDISGTVIPLSSLNNVVGNIPLIGDILTGGDALFAATYALQGPSSDPKVSVNPLSVLAPGFLRKILFEGDVDSKVKKQEKQ